MEIGELDQIVCPSDLHRAEATLDHDPGPVQCIPDSDSFFFAENFHV